MLFARERTTLGPALRKRNINRRIGNLAGVTPNLRLALVLFGVVSMQVCFVSRELCSAFLLRLSRCLWHAGPGAFGTLVMHVYAGAYMQQEKQELSNGAVRSAYIVVRMACTGRTAS